MEVDHERWAKGLKGEVQLSARWSEVTHHAIELEMRMELVDGIYTV